MSSKRASVLITGSSGLIGSALMKRLSPSFDVVGLDVHEPSLQQDGAADGVFFHLGSEESTGLAVKYVREVHHSVIASVIHLAAFYDFSGKDNPLYKEINLRGTTQLLSQLRTLMVEQIVYSSTMLVHAPCQPGEFINEDSPLKPQWEHPRSSLQTENIIRRHHGDTPFVLLRIAGVYDDYCHSIPLAHQIQRIYEQQFLGHAFPGHPSHGQAFVHLDDLVEVFHRLIQRRKDLPPELTLLIGEPETISYKDIQDELGKHIHGHKWETHAIPKVLAKAELWAQAAVTGREDPFLRPWMVDRADDHYALDITRARTLLGWEPRRSLREALPKMIAALKEDPQRWDREHRLKLP